MRQERQTLRQTLVFLDYSEAIKEDDYKPSRQIVALEALQRLAEKYEENNPLSQLGVFLLRDLRCQPFLELGAGKQERQAVLEGFLAAARADGRFSLHSSLLIKGRAEHEAAGQISLFNALNRACEIFERSPAYFTREVYLLLSSTGTNDARDIYEAARRLQQLGARLHTISLSCANFLLAELARRLGGALFVPGSKLEFEESVYNVANPLPASGRPSCLFPVAFVSLVHNHYPFYCECHKQWQYKGYSCSLCAHVHCAPVAVCALCRVKLVAPTDITRRAVNEGLREKFAQASGRCALCEDEAGERRCAACGLVACRECFEFVFEDIRFCIGCFEL